MAATKRWQYGSLIIAVSAAGWLANWMMSPSEAELVSAGRGLFLHEWEPNDELSGDGDGLGPVFNAKSCVACHFQGGVGGGGDSKHNVTSFQVLPNRRTPVLQSGVVHASATAPEFEETTESLRYVHPSIPESTRVVGGCTVRFDAFDPLLVEQINTPALFGVGVIDSISSYAVKSQRRARLLNQTMEELNLNFDVTTAGKLRTHSLGAVGKFGWRGQFDTLEEFVATACAVEIGLTNPQRAQDIPKKHKPDGEAKYDMDAAQLKALITYCRNLPRPEQILPTDAEELKNVRNGEKLFAAVGCADCHTPNIGGVEGIYTDFLLYSLEGPDTDGYRKEFEVPLPTHLPKPSEWQTPPLWGVADSAPYFHDGASETLEDAIKRHRGAAEDVRNRFRNLDDNEERDLIAFLKSLRAPVTADVVSSLAELND